MNGTTEYHVFSKMFQPPVTRGPEELCDLLAAAGCDGVQWTVRPGGHVEPERAREDLPRFVAAAASRGLRCRSICTAIGDGSSPADEELLRVTSSTASRTRRRPRRWSASAARSPRSPRSARGRA